MTENLLQETLECLEQNNKTEADVLWVGSKDLYTTWDNFKEIANFNYDSGYGGQEIASDLIIVGDNWWLERGEYDGAEWWEFKTIPMKPEKERRIESLSEGCWNSLFDINFPEETE